VGIKDRKIDMGHARALITVEDPVKQLHIYDQILKNNHSVRKVEELVRLMNESEDSNERLNTEKEAKDKLPEEYFLLKEQLKELFHSKVDLARNAKGKGKITIPFANDEELEKIMDIFDSIQKG